MNNKTSKKAIILKLTFVVVIIFCFICIILLVKEYSNIRLNYEKSKAEQNIEIGKSVGRNSMLLYLDKTKQLKDTVTIDIKDLLIIEDIIQTYMLNKYKDCNVDE
jgi:preprotein translocase subunit SecG